jgi:hypothetical protein
LIQLDYELRPALWIECGLPEAAKLDKLAVKAPLAELWIVTRSAGEIEALMREMRRRELRQNRYRLLGFEATIFDELVSLFGTRNELTLYRLDFAERLIQIDFNGVWFEGSLELESF